MLDEYLVPCSQSFEGGKQQHHQQLTEFPERQQACSKKETHLAPKRTCKEQQRPQIRGNDQDWIRHHTYLCTYHCWDNLAGQINKIYYVYKKLIAISERSKSLSEK